jgi:hypothetical protein
VILSLCAGLATGCTGSDSTVVGDTTQATTTDTVAPDIDATSPRSYADVLARLPPFDEAASPEVAAWRKATIAAFFQRCLRRTGGAAKRSFVAANRGVLNDAARFPGAVFVRETSVAQRDGNGCPAETGPATSYTTSRTYRLPARTKPEAVLDHYQHAFYGWVAASSPVACERTFGQGPAYVIVNACHGVLRVHVRARAPVQIGGGASLPPRPLGLQYPIVERHAGEPAAFESEPGATCERIRGSEVPSIIIPPVPGISAEFRGDDLVVTWKLGLVHGDCPPSALAVTYGAAMRSTAVQPVHAASGVARIALGEQKGPHPARITVRALSVDGTLSRAVSVVVRKAR